MLMRTALELSKSGYKVFYHHGSEVLEVDSAVEVLSKVQDAFILVVDSMAEHATQLADLLLALERVHVPYYVLGAERFHRLQRVESAFYSVEHQQSSVKHLSTGEAVALVQKLRALGLLGLAAGKRIGELAKRIESGGLMTGIIEISSNGRNFAQIVEEEWRALAEPVSQRIYAVVSVASACGYPVKTSIVSRAVENVRAPEVLRLLETSLRGNVVASSGNEFLQVRHRLVAESLLDTLPADAVFDAMVSLTHSLGPYVNREMIKRGTAEARLSRRLLNYDDIVRPRLRDRANLFYEKIKDEWGWNSRYWEQRALMELSEGNVDSARSYAEHAVGLEYHPFPLTTLAIVEFSVAKTAGIPAIRDRSLTEAVKRVDEALELAKQWRRVDFKPYDVGIRGILESCEADGRLRRAPPSRAIVDRLRSYLADSALRRMYDAGTVTKLKERARAVGISVN
jgi:hypothetical protein